MRFGPVTVDDAVGAYLAHAMDAGAARFRKGRRLTPDDVATLRAAGIGHVIAAVLEAGDVGEDEAATRLAGALAVDGVDLRPAATGRVNVHARAAGVFTVNRALVDAINALDPGVTLATLAPFARVERDQMVATVKIIPFAVTGSLMERAEKTASAMHAFAVHRFVPATIGLVQTRLPGVKPGVLDKTVRVTAERLARSGSRLGREVRCAHEENAVAAAIRELLADCDLVVAFGASAMTDPADVIPQAIRMAGGVVERAGMPVDPGNLLVLGSVGGKTVIGAPGCARSIKENGFDWVLDRLLAGVDVDAASIASMGVGGLLMEISSRPRPREGAADAVGAQVVAVVLAAGQARRMGGPNKLLATFEGVPLVRRTVERVRASRVTRTVVVAGHQATNVRSALGAVDAVVVDNPDFALGLSTSLKAGLAAAGDAEGILVVLADMPAIATADIDRMVTAFRDNPGAVIRATCEGRRGNPVLLPRALFAEISHLHGDAGARHLVESADLEVIDVEIGAAAGIDVDTPEALAAAGGILQT